MDKVILEYEWEETGTLTIEVEGNYSARARFYPSDKAIMRAINDGRFTLERHRDCVTTNNLQEDKENPNPDHYSNQGRDYNGQV